MGSGSSYELHKRKLPAIYTVVQIQCCFVHKLFIWDLDSWLLYRGGLYSGVAVKRGSTGFLAGDI